MRRRFVICITGLLSLTVGGLGAFWYFTQPEHRINERAVKQIQKGMSLAEVEAVFGVPAGDYSTRSIPELWGLLLDEPREKAWKSNEISVRVHFNDDLCVAHTSFVRYPNQPWWIKIRRSIMHE